MGSTRNRLILVALGAAGAAGVLARDRVMRLVRGPVGAAPPPSAPAHRETAPPQLSNYDASGPVANTATPIPAPDHREREPIDEEAEIAAAAAEAAAIGGVAPEYPGLGLSEEADEAYRPLEEAGEGEAEGQEISERDLVDAAQPSDTMSDAQWQIEQTIEAQDAPYLGETPEPLASTAGEPVAEAEQAARDAARTAGEGIPGAEPATGFGGDPSRPPGDGDAAEPSSERPGGA